MNDTIKELAKQSALWFVTDREDLIEDFAKLVILHTLQAARVGMEFGPSMDEAVTAYFKLKQ